VDSGLIDKEAALRSVPSLQAKCKKGAPTDLIFRVFGILLVFSRVLFFRIFGIFSGGFGLQFRHQHSTSGFTIIFQRFSECWPVGPFHSSGLSECAGCAKSAPPFSIYAL